MLQTDATQWHVMLPQRVGFGVGVWRGNHWEQWEQTPWWQSQLIYWISKEMLIWYEQHVTCILSVICRNVHIFLWAGKDHSHVLNKPNMFISLNMTRAEGQRWQTLLFLSDTLTCACTHVAEQHLCYSVDLGHTVECFLSAAELILCHRVLNVLRQLLLRRADCISSPH